MARMKTNGGTARKYTGRVGGWRAGEEIGRGEKGGMKGRRKMCPMPLWPGCSLKAWNTVLRLNDRFRYHDKKQEGGKGGTGKMRRDTANIDISRLNSEFDISGHTIFSRAILSTFTRITLYHEISNNLHPSQKNTHESSTRHAAILKHPYASIVCPPVCIIRRVND